VWWEKKKERNEGKEREKRGQAVKRGDPGHTRERTRPQPSVGLIILRPMTGQRIPSVRLPMFLSSFPPSPPKLVSFMLHSTSHSRPPQPNQGDPPRRFSWPPRHYSLSPCGTAPQSFFFPPRTHGDTIMTPPLFIHSSPFVFHSPFNASFIPLILARIS